MKKGFTLIEMLVVVGIIAVLVGASLGAYSKMTKTAERARCQELVTNTATALNALFVKEGVWPLALRKGGSTDGELDSDAAFALAPRSKGDSGYMSLTVDYDSSGNSTKLSGLDRFGIVSPWAAAHIKRRGNSASLGDKVALGTLKDHILHYALDLDGDGIIEDASVGGEPVTVRANAIVWCCGKDGKMETYSRGLRTDDVYSWTKGQTQNVK